jgi:uncharacterized iron-regulated protein
MYRARLFNLRDGPRYGHTAGEEDAELLASARLVILGEIHGAAPCIELECRTASAMLTEAESAGGTLHIFMEHFNFEMQPLLVAYGAGEVTLDELIEGSRS